MAASAPAWFWRPPRYSHWVRAPAPAGWQANGLPASRYLVGGGFEIDWPAPSAGTVIVAEGTSAKVLQTRHLDSGDSFEFKVPEDGTVQKLTGRGELREKWRECRLVCVFSVVRGSRGRR